MKKNIMYVETLSDILSDILREIQKCPEDSLQDITNEVLRKYEVDLGRSLICNHRFEIEEVI